MSGLLSHASHALISTLFWLPNCAKPVAFRLCTIAENLKIPPPNSVRGALSLNTSGGYFGAFGADGLAHKEYSETVCQRQCFTMTGSRGNTIANIGLASFTIIRLDEGSKLEEAEQLARWGLSESSWAETASYLFKFLFRPMVRSGFRATVHLRARGRLELGCLKFDFCSRR